MAPQGDTEQFKQTVIRLEGRVERLEQIVGEIRQNRDMLHKIEGDVRTLLHKIDIEVEGVQTQMKITWILLMLLVSGFIGVAFSLWKGGLPVP